MSRRPKTFWVFGLLVLTLCFGCGDGQSDGPVAEGRGQAPSVSSQSQQAHELHVACLAGGGTWADGKCQRSTSGAPENTSAAATPSSTLKPEGHDHGSHSHEAAAQPVRSGTAAGLRLFNLTSVPTATLEADAVRASSLMANRQSDVLAVIYPVGSHIADVSPGAWSPDGNPEHGKPFAKFERVISQEQVEAMLDEIQTWMAAHHCIDAEHRNHQLAEYRLWMEGGADVSSQMSLCGDVRLVMMAVPDGMPDWGLHQFLVHELYHAFQHDLEERQCQEDGRTMFVEGAAEYFAYFLTEKRFLDRPAVTTLLENALNDHQRGDGIDQGNATAAAAALRLMVERGDLAHDAIMDGSLFHSCARSGEYGPDVPSVQSARSDWVQIEKRDGEYEFAAAVVGRTASTASGPPVTGGRPSDDSGATSDSPVSHGSSGTGGPLNLLVAGCDDERLEILPSVRQALAGLGFTQCSTPFGILLAAATDMPGPAVTYAAKIVAEFMDQDRDGYADHAELAAMLKYPGGVDDQRAWLAMPTRHAGWEEGASRDHKQKIGHEIGIPAWWLWGDAGRNGDFSAGLDEHAKAVIWEEIDHFVHQFGLSNVFPEEFGVQNWDSLVAQETKRAACEWWQHPENDCPGKPREHDGPPGGCADPGCDVVEFFHQVQTMRAGMQPGWLGIGFPGNKQELEARLSSQFKALMDDPRFPLVRRPLKGDYPLAGEVMTVSETPTAAPTMVAKVFPPVVASVPAQAGATGAGVRYVNLTDVSTSELEAWTKVLEAKMARRQSDVLYMMWPIGKWIGPCEGCFDNHPLEQHERVISQDQVEFLLGELKSWMATTSIDSDHANSELATWRKVLEGGGDAATQFSLSQSSRFIMHGVEQGRVASDVYHTVTHELYHAFQHDISPDGECHNGSRMMVEAGADYFAYVVLENKYPDYGVGGLLRDASRSYQDEGELAIRGSSAAAGALLRLLVERGHASHEAVMDGSFYHACARGNELGSDTPAMKQALQDWFKIEAHAGSYRFDPGVVSNA